MSKFWQKKYISKYTGEEIDAAVAKAGDATKVTANPTLAGTEAALEGLQVGETKYKAVSRILKKFDDTTESAIAAAIAAALPTIITDGHGSVIYTIASTNEAAYALIASCYEALDDGNTNIVLNTCGIDFVLNFSAMIQGDDVLAIITGINYLTMQFNAFVVYFLITYDTLVDSYNLTFYLDQIVI